ncbi:GroES-like protein [Cylindrobasidium torrendii FP15055 ss-10]|uniref:GroES-like protein n=1 Tax=Cylindrobasidium torrendii FP15055 ss-10 TaxID=1314674 RepID=A0A0D7B3K2_9AGAR|nr:GroES-like protein [Cylindrobasidium torrendii FP15055 ss-10]
MAPQTHKAVATTALGVFDEIDVETDIPKAGEVLLKVEYASMIAFDTYQTDLGYVVEQYPNILGFNASGIVAAVGPNVDSLKVGDRITAFTYLSNKQRGMQRYCVQPISVCAKIPDSLSLAAAATIPDNFVTAYRAIFFDVGLPIPKSYTGDDTPALVDSPILIWGGGATSAQYQIQVLRAAGYRRIFTTASASHHEYLKSLGASDVFDYRSPTLATEIIEAAGGKRIERVVDCISAEKTITAIAEFIDPNGILAILLPYKRGDNVRAAGDTSAMSWELWPEAPIPATVAVKGVRAFKYQDFEYLKENLLPKILPEMLEKNVIQPNRVKLLDQGTFQERVAVGLELLRKNGVHGEKIIVKVEH